jgi:ribonuclease D
MNPHGRRWRSCPFALSLSKGLFHVLRQFQPERPGARMNDRLEAPDRDQIALLPPFPSLELPHIWLVATAADAQRAAAELLAQPVLGFDTESKPTFVRNEVSQGPHVVQFSTLQKAYVFQLQDPLCREVAGAVLASPAVTKAGFGLASDVKQIAAKFGAAPNAVVDIDTLFRRQGYRKELGVKAAVAVVFGERFSKSKKASTSNWAARQLTTAQILYAANDAYAAMCVFHALNGRASAA